MNPRLCQESAERFRWKNNFLHFPDRRGFLPRCLDESWMSIRSTYKSRKRLHDATFDQISNLSLTRARRLSPSLSPFRRCFFHFFFLVFALGITCDSSWSQPVSRAHAAVPFRRDDTMLRYKILCSTENLFEPQLSLSLSVFLFSSLKRYADPTRYAAWITPSDPTRISDDFPADTEAPRGVIASSSHNHAVSESERCRRSEPNRAAAAAAAAAAVAAAVSESADTRSASPEREAVERQARSGALGLRCDGESEKGQASTRRSQQGRRPLKRGGRFGVGGCRLIWLLARNCFMRVNNGDYMGASLSFSLFLFLSYSMLLNKSTYLQHRSVYNNYRPTLRIAWDWIQIITVDMIRHNE